MGSIIAFAAVATALILQSVVPIAPAALRPTGPWHVEYADSMCTLQRDFGSGEAKVTLGFKPGPLSDSMRIVLIQKGDESPLVQGDAELSFDGGIALKDRFVEHVIAAKGIRVIVIDLKESELMPLKSAKQVWIRAGKLDFTLTPTAVPKAMEALEACESDLLASWGMDPAAIDAIATYPVPRGSIFRYTDYPATAIRNDQQGTVGVRFWVTKKGWGRDCVVVESSGSAILDTQTCAIINKRGRYEPAHAKSGEAVESISYARIRWEMP